MPPSKLKVVESVVGEFVPSVQNPKKMQYPLADRAVDVWAAIEIDREVIESAIFLPRRYWDSQIPAAAHRFAADTLFGEDLGHEQPCGMARCQNALQNP
jgi:hypothetical protein